MQSPGRPEGVSPMDFMLQCMTPLHSHQSARRGPDPRLFSIRSRGHDNVIPAAGRRPGGRAGTGDCMAAGNGYAPLRSFVLIGTACPINAFPMSTVSCLTRFFPTRPAALARRSGVSKGLTLSPVAMTGAAAMLRNKRTAIFHSAAAGHRAGRPRPATAVPERGIMADSPP